MTTKIRVINEGPGDVSVKQNYGGVIKEVTHLKPGEVSAAHLSTFTHDVSSFVVEEVPPGK